MYADMRANHQNSAMEFKDNLHSPNMKPILKLRIKFKIPPSKVIKFAILKTQISLN